MNGTDSPYVENTGTNEDVSVTKNQTVSEKIIAAIENTMPKKESSMKLKADTK